MAPEEEPETIEVEAEEAELEVTDDDKTIDAPPAGRMDLYESAEAQLDAEKIPAWRPDKEDPHRIVGEVIAIDLAVNVGGATCPIVLTVNTKEAGLRRVWGWHTVLLNELISAQPQITDVVGFAYGGRSKSASGREYVSYSVAVAREAGGPQEIDYHRLAIEAAPRSELDEEPRVEKSVPASGGSTLGPDDDLPFYPSVA